MRKMAILFFMITMLCPSFRVLADSGGYIVKFKDEYIPEEIKNSLSDSCLGNNVYLTDNIDILKSYVSFVEYIETNDTVTLIDSEADRIQCFSTDETNFEPWQLDMVNAQYAWDLATYGNGINVGIIDSGCNQHIDITNNLAGGHNYMLDTDDYSDNIGHGTHVAGIIAAENNGFGITGVAPKATIEGTVCDEMPINGNFDLEVSLYSTTTDFNPAIILVAVYNENGTLMQIKYSDVLESTLSDDEKTKIHIDTTNVPINHIKTFVWNSLNGMVLLSDRVDIYSN